MADWVDKYYDVPFVEIKEPIGILNLRALDIVPFPVIKSTPYVGVSSNIIFDRYVLGEQNDG